MSEEQSEEKQDKGAGSEEEQSQLSSEQLEQASGGLSDAVEDSSTNILRDASEAITWVPDKPEDGYSSDDSSDDLGDFDRKTR